MRTRRAEAIQAGLGHAADQVVPGGAGRAAEPEMKTEHSVMPYASKIGVPVAVRHRAATSSLSFSPADRACRIWGRSGIGCRSILRKTPGVAAKTVASVRASRHPLPTRHNRIALRLPELDLPRFN